MGGLAARIAKLEQRGKRPSAIHNSVARFTPEGQLVGPMPKSKRIMVVKDHGTDAEWEAALLKQQSKLIGDAQAAEHATQTKD